MDTVTQSDEARIAARYAKRSPLDLVLALVGGLAVLGAIGLVIATGLTRSNPPVAGMVRSFEVVSPSEITAELVIQRETPGDAVECRLFAQAPSYETVAEDIISVEPGTDHLTTVNVTLQTVKEATSISLDACRVVP